MFVDGILAKPTQINYGWIAYRFIAIVFFSFAFLFYLSLPVGSDWQLAFRPAALNLLSGKSPYSVEYFFNPPWVLLPLVPLALLPEHLGSALISLISMIALAYAAWKLGAKPIIILLFLTTPYAFASTNIDWMVALGILMRPWIGLIFVMTKPQLGLPIAVFWFINGVRENGIKRTALEFAPVSLAFVLSFLIFGFYPLRGSELLDAVHNISLWPWSIPFGLAILAHSLRKQEMRFAMASGPLLSPYVMAWSLPTALIGFLPFAIVARIAITGIWIIDILGAPWNFSKIIIQSSSLFTP